MLFPSKVYVVDYTVGQTGPAGGIIFYDKGHDSDGWRYLEAAPSDQSESTIWSNITDSAAGTDIAIGTGQTNTAKILEQDPTAPAALACENLFVTNIDTDITYVDWFLPSIEELHEMYVNLYQEGLGGFANAWYWSSSEYVNDAYSRISTRIRLSTRSSASAMA